MKDDSGIVQLFTVSPNGGIPRQVTHNSWNIASAFTWSPDGRQITCAIDNSVFVIDVETGDSRRLTPKAADQSAPRPEACVFSPDGKSIAYIRPVKDTAGLHNQIFILEPGTN
jgi:Tol biopolymer transport system component